MRVWVLFMLAASLLVLPWAIRWTEGNFQIGGEASYYHARMGVALAEGKFGADMGVVGGREYVLSPYHVLIAFFYRLFGDAALVLLPMFIAWCSVLLFWVVLREVRFSAGERFWALLAFILSPPLVASGFLLSPHGFVVLLFLGALALIRTRFWWISGVLLVLAGLCGLPFLLGMIGAVLVMVFVWPEFASRLNLLAVILLVFLIAGLYAPVPIEEAGIEGFVSDLGGLFGAGLFSVLLAVLGLILLWEYKRRFLGAFVCVFASLVAGFFFPGVLIVVSVLFAMLVGLGLSRLWEREWELRVLRDATLLVLFCGLLFSTVSHAVALGHAAPSEVFFQGVALPKGVVFTHQKYGFWAEFAGHTVVTDGLGASAQAAEDAGTLLASTDVERTLALIEKYNIKYVVITPEMTQGLVWERDEQGLDFLVRNSEMFKRVDPELSVRVYEVE